MTRGRLPSLLLSVLSAGAALGAGPPEAHPFMHPDRSALLTFCLHIDTAQPAGTPPARFSVFIADPANASDAKEVQACSNTDAAPGFTAHSVDLAACRGRTVNVDFSCQEGTRGQTSFVLDDVALTVDLPGPERP
jgi:hypothetical protein